MMKKLSAILLALVMVLSLTATAFADAVSNNTDHDYKAYQIFSGTQNNVDGDTALGDVQWGSGIDATQTDDLMTAVKAIEGDAFASCADAAAVAVVLSALGDNDPAVLAFAQTVSKYLSADATAIAAGATSVDLAAGYYLLVDQKATSGALDEVKGLSLLQVTKDGAITITSKTGVPSVDKQVKDDITDGENETGWGETADHEIGEEFQFQLVATIPADTMTHFNTYKIVFTDTMSAGLTFVKIDSVTVNGTPIAKPVYADTSAADQAGLTWTLTIDDVKTAITGLDTTAATTIVVTYTAKLNANAKVGNDPSNFNKVGLQYSNNPNVSGDGYSDELGKTPEDTVWVFTYDLDVTKVDGTNNELKLKDAEFVLYKGEKGSEQYATVDADGKITGWAEATTGADGKVAYPANSTLKSDANGLFKVIGLDVGTYYLKETKAPTGYNLLKTPITVLITATSHSENEEGTSASVVDLKVNGKDAISVENNKGATLPETGGMGTTILYIVGGLLVLGAAVLLITKKRMENN